MTKGKAGAILKKTGRSAFGFAYIRKKVRTINSRQTGDETPGQGVALQGIQGAIFDVDGTLLDSLYAWKTIAGDYLRRRGQTPREDLTAQFRTMSLPQAAAYYQRAYGLRDSADSIMAGINVLLAKAYQEDVQAKPGAEAFLARLGQKGVVMCVATATDLGLVNAALERLGLKAYFQMFFGCTELGMNKDRPDIFRYARQRLGTDPAATWVFEDSPHAAESARLAGLQVAGLYDPAHHDCGEIMAKICHIYARDFQELAQYFGL